MHFTAPETYDYLSGAEYGLLAGISARQISFQHGAMFTCVPSHHHSHTRQAYVALVMLHKLPQRAHTSIFYVGKSSWALYLLNDVPVVRLGSLRLYVEYCRLLKVHGIDWYNAQFVSRPSNVCMTSHSTISQMFEDILLRQGSLTEMLWKI